MKLRTALDRDWLKKLPLLHKVNTIPFPPSNRFGLLFCFVLFLQSVVRLEYSLAEASVIIERLSINWDHVKKHLNRVARLPSYRFHIREVMLHFINLLFSQLFGTLLPFFHQSLFILAKLWMNAFGWKPHT